MYIDDIINYSHNISLQFDVLIKKRHIFIFSAKFFGAFFFSVFMVRRAVKKTMVQLQTGSNKNFYCPIGVSLSFLFLLLLSLAISFTLSHSVSFFHTSNIICKGSKIFNIFSIDSNCCWFIFILKLLNCWNFFDFNKISNLRENLKKCSN